MTLPRRRFLHLAAGAAALPAMSRAASALDYPTRPVRIVVGFAPGGATDIAARLIGQWLSDRLGQPFTVENRPGASTNVAAEVVVHSPPDGYTLMAFSISNTVNPALFTQLNFNFVRDMSGVAGINSSPLVLEINPAVPVTSVPELITYAKANSGKISLGNFGVGTSSHVVGELFKMMAGVNMVDVPYRGGAPMVTDLLGGQVQVAFDNLSGSIEQIRAGKLRALAVTTVSRSPALPNVPTLGKFLPGFEADSWIAIGAPKNTPAEIIDKLNREINAGLADPKIVARLTDFGSTALTLSPADLDKFVVDETEKWGKVVRAAGIKAE
ncbi:MAG TPA: tripartite tricarboxylate transporter substrate binding protein [Steroidobacteraceae bacterium]|jgi:tripartite-type tricarboxylate transporter receptor subunit TctC|nr:tripartite tricarboxylate transporter substrate binding protein [Steroidobacteraceae bacterium]